VRKSLKRFPLVIVCAALAIVPAIALAANPKPGGRYSGRSKPILGNARHSVVIKVSSNGRRGTIRYCGDRRRRSTSAGFGLRNGRFSATKRERRSGKRVVTFQAKGTFASRRRVTGQIVVVFKCDHAPGTFTARLR